MQLSRNYLRLCSKQSLKTSACLIAFNHDSYRPSSSYPRKFKCDNYTLKMIQSKGCQNCLQYSAKIRFLDKGSQSCQNYNIRKLLRKSNQHIQCKTWGSRYAYAFNILLYYTTFFPLQKLTLALK